MVKNDRFYIESATRTFDWSISIEWRCVLFIEGRPFGARTIDAFPQRSTNARLISLEIFVGENPAIRFPSRLCGRRKMDEKYRAKNTFDI